MSHDTTQPAVEVSMTVEIVMAYVTNNSVPASELPGLIASVHAEIAKLSAPPAPEPVEDHTVSAAAIRKSITPDHLISFIDGKPYKSLKRHLTAKGYTPESYRSKFGLPVDYPLVAENYAAQRSALAKNSGLGQWRKLRAVA